MAHDERITQSVRDFIAQGEVYLSYPTRCDCGATVRRVGNLDPAGAWHCPLCGEKLPYVFWKVHHTPKQRVDDLSVLILELAADACPTCGESQSKPPCRCQRRAQAEAREAERQVWERDAKIFPGGMADKFDNPH